MITKKNFLTEEGLKKLGEELNELKRGKRKEIAERIQAAKELGDLSENAEYIEAKEEQGFIEARIVDLEKMLKNSVLITRTHGATTVQIGSTLTVRSADGNEITFTIVGSSEADPSQQRISNESPFGQAFMGHKVGDQVDVNAPRGKQAYEIAALS